MLLIAPDLLRSLWGIFFRLQQMPVGLSTDIEEISLQVEVEKDDEAVFDSYREKLMGRQKCCSITDTISERSQHRRVISCTSAEHKYLQIRSFRGHFSGSHKFLHGRYTRFNRLCRQDKCFPERIAKTAFEGKFQLNQIGFKRLICVRRCETT